MRRCACAKETNSPVDTLQSNQSRINDAQDLYTVLCPSWLKMRVQLSGVENELSKPCTSSQFIGPLSTHLTQALHTLKQIVCVNSLHTSSWALWSRCLGGPWVLLQTVSGREELVLFKGNIWGKMDRVTFQWEWDYVTSLITKKSYVLVVFLQDLRWALKFRLVSEKHYSYYHDQQDLDMIDIH